MPDAQNAPQNDVSSPGAGTVPFLQKLASTRLLFAALPLPAIATAAQNLSDAKFLGVVGATAAVAIAYIICNTIRPR